MHLANLINVLLMQDPDYIHPQDRCFIPEYVHVGNREFYSIIPINPVKSTLNYTKDFIDYKKDRPTIANAYPICKQDPMIKSKVSHIKEQLENLFSIQKIKDVVDGKVSFSYKPVALTHPMNKEVRTVGLHLSLPVVMG